MKKLTTIKVFIKNIEVSRDKLAVGMKGSDQPPKKIVTTIDDINII